MPTTKSARRLSPFRWLGTCLLRCLFLVGCSEEWDPEHTPECDSCSWLIRGVPVQAETAAIVGNELFVLGRGTATLWSYSLRTGDRNALAHNLYAPRSILPLEDHLWLTNSVRPGEPLLEVWLESGKTLEVFPFGSHARIGRALIGPNDSVIVEAELDSATTLASLNGDGSPDTIIDINQSEVLHLLDANETGVLWSHNLGYEWNQLWIADSSFTKKELPLPLNFVGDAETAKLLSAGVVLLGNDRTYLLDFDGNLLEQFEEMHHLVRVLGTKCGYVGLHTGYDKFSVFDSSGKRLLTESLPGEVTTPPLSARDKIYFLGTTWIVSIQDGCQEDLAE